MGYPWQIGDALLATDLNDAIAGAGSVGGAVNVLDHGADPTGVLDSSDAINAAAAVVSSGSTRHRAVYLPTGVYRVNKQINLSASQGLVGDTRGSSVLYVDDRFDPAATSVIMCTSGGFDPGPVLRDFGVTFQQPSDQGSRANFKTLAAGGTSSTGGTGVKYPWAIASGSDSFRIQCIRVRIGGAWDGITTNNHNTVYWLDDIEMGALDCGVSIGEGAAGGVMDFCHISGYHFWNFDLGGSLFNVFKDGQTQALRVGRCDGLDVRGLTCFLGRVIFTGENGGYTMCHITNAMMDGVQSYIEVNSGGVGHLNISNIYTTAGTERVRPFLNINGAGNIHITNFYSFSSSNYPEIFLNDYDARVFLSNFNSTFYTNNVHWAEVQRGILKLSNGYLYLQGPRSVSAIAETLDGNILVDSVYFSGANASGPLISTVTNGAYTTIGSLTLQPSNTWTFSFAAGTRQTFYSPTTRFQGIGGSSMYIDGVIQSGLTSGSPGNVVIVGAAGEQKALIFTRAANLAWALVSATTTDDFNVIRYDASGGFVDTPLSINRTTGVVSALKLVPVSFGMNSPAVGRQTVTGSRGGNAALASLLTALAAFGFITDSTSA
jgi:hypothetical protein